MVRNHEDEGLQHDDQDVEHSPRPMQRHAQRPSRNRPLPNITAIRMKISSPAYMLPNRRRAREIGLAIRVTNSEQEVHRDQQDLTRC